jgi:putative surface-exposed virulence protein
MSCSGRYLIIELILIIVANLAWAGSAADSNQTNNETNSLSNNFSSSIIIINPGDSIQDAIQRSSPGSIIEVHGGTYRENINVTKNLTIRGIDDGDGLPVVDAQKNGSAITISANGVHIDNLTAENSGYEAAGIRVTSNNCIIERVSVRNSYYGLNLISSNYSKIFAINLSESQNGICLESSDNNSLLENDITGNGHGYGIKLNDSENNLISSNNLSNSEIAINLDSSGSNQLNDNWLFGNKIIFAMDGKRIYDFNNDIDATNIAEGRPVYYLKGARDKIIDASSNGLLIGCFNCTNVTVQDRNSSNGYTSIIVVNTHSSKFMENNLSIRLCFCNNNTISQNKINASEPGVFLYSSDNNILKSNTVQGCDFGFNLESSNANALISNYLDGNKNDIRLDSSDNNRIMENDILGNTYGLGIELTDSDNNSLGDNNVSDNEYCIRLSSSDNNTVFGNNLNDSESTVQLYFSDHNILLDNNLSHKQDGVGLFSSDNNSLLENDVTGLYYGEGICIHLEESKNNYIKGNNLSKSKTSISLSSSNNNSILRNSLKDNREGIRLYTSDNNSLLENDFFGPFIKYGSGIILGNSGNNYIAGNNLSNSGTGVRLSSSNNNSLLHNNVKDNKDGIQLSSSDNNSLFENEVIGHDFASGSGINLHYSKNNSLTGNNLSNSEMGISFYSSGGNRLTNNLISGNKTFLGMHGERISDFDNDIDATNFAEGIPIYYLNGAHDKIVDASSNGLLIGCFNCTNVTVQDRNSSNGYTSIIVANTHSSKFIHNNISIRLYFSNNNTINQNKINEDGNGILLHLSDNNTLKGNEIQGGDFGFSLESSENNSLDGNNVSNSETGMFLYSSRNNRLNDNLMSKNNIYVRIEGDNISDFDNDIDETNLAEGIPIYYLNGARDKIADASSNGLLIGCFNCTNVTVRDIKCSNGYTSIIVANTHNSKFIDNNISIRLYFSDNNTINQNKIGDDEYGILLRLSDNNSLEGNEIQGCDFGFSLESSNSNALFNNYLEDNEDSIHLHSSNSNAIFSNYLEDNIDGIHLDFSDNNSILKNDIVGGGYDFGIELANSNNNNISLNKAKNSSYGIKIISSNSNSVKDNSLGDNITYHVVFDVLDNNEFKNNSKKEIKWQGLENYWVHDTGSMAEPDSEYVSPPKITGEGAHVSESSGSSGNRKSSSDEELRSKPSVSTLPDDEDLKKLFGGIISFKPTIPMVVNETTDVIARIAPNNTSASETIYAIKETNAELVIKGLTISKWMRLSLQDPGKKFQLEALSNTDQKILGDVPATWRWTVTPKEEGKHRLILVATLLEEKENGEKEAIRDVDVQTELIDVIANKNETIKASKPIAVSEVGRDISSFIKEVVGLLTAIFALIIAYRKLKKGES